MLTLCPTSLQLLVHLLGLLLSAAGVGSALTLTPSITLNDRVARLSCFEITCYGKILFYIK